MYLTKKNLVSFFLFIFEEQIISKSPICFFEYLLIMKVIISQEQVKILRNKKQTFISENLQIFSDTDVVDEKTYEVKLKDIDNMNDILIVDRNTNGEYEPTLISLMGKKRFDLVTVVTENGEKIYKIWNITTVIGKINHENFDEIKSIGELITKLKNDPYFQQKKITTSKIVYKTLEELNKKDESSKKRIMQIFYLLFRRSGSLKKFETKLNRFIPFMRLLLDKGDIFFNCITKQLETALDNSDDKFLSSFAQDKSNFESLINYIKNLKECDEELSFDFESIFKTSNFAKYERQFVGDHFKYSPTSVSMNIEITEKIENFDELEFNNTINLNKMKMILSWVLLNKKENDTLESLMEYFVDKLKITFPNVIKRDLITIKEISNKNNDEILLNVGDFVEVKYKNHESSDFLCEFFKPESHNSSMEYLVRELKSIRKDFNSTKEVKYLIGLLDTAIVEKIKKDKIGEEVIDNIKKYTAGILFKDYIFVKMSDIDLKWTNIGYGKNPRIAIEYSVKENYKKYILNMSQSDKEQINSIYWTN